MTSAGSGGLSSFFNTHKKLIIFAGCLLGSGLLIGGCIFVAYRNRNTDPAENIGEPIVNVGEVKKDNKEKGNKNGKKERKKDDKKNGENNNEDDKKNGNDKKKDENENDKKDDKENDEKSLANYTKNVIGKSEDFGRAAANNVLQPITTVMNGWSKDAESKKLLKDTAVTSTAAVALFSTIAHFVGFSPIYGVAAGLASAIGLGFM